MRQLVPLFGVSKSAADRIIDHLGPMFALQSRKRFAKDAVLIVDGALVPTRDHAIAERSKNYRYSNRLVIVVGRPLAGNHNDCKTWEESGAKAALGKTPSPTADPRAPDRSSRTAASAARANSRTGKRSTTSPTSRSGPASSTSSPA